MIMREPQAEHFNFSRASRIAAVPITPFATKSAAGISTNLSRPRQETETPPPIAARSARVIDKDGGTLGMAEEVSRPERNENLLRANEHAMEGEPHRAGIVHVNADLAAAKMAGTRAIITGGTLLATTTAIAQPD